MIDLARNLAGLDDSLLKTPDLNLIRSTIREWRDEARAVVEAYDPLTVAPGADDLTFGGVMNEMIRRQFERRTFPKPEPHFGTVCLHCQGFDIDRKLGQRTSLHLVQHKPDCLLAKHLPRLQAMANKGVT